MSHLKVLLAITIFWQFACNVKMIPVVVQEIQLIKMNYARFVPGGGVN